VTPLTKTQKAQFSKFAQEPLYQEKVDAIKALLTELNKVQLAETLVQFKEEKDALEEQTYDLNVRLEAVMQLLNDRLEDEGITSFNLKDGRCVYQQSDVYVKVENREDFHTWLRTQEDGESFFSVNYQTCAALTKSRIEQGETIPPGLNVFIKQLVKTRKGN
jgi:hypothetical protein